MKVVNLIQGSPEWLQFRQENYPASEAPSMMGAGKYDPKTPEQLALYRLGIKSRKITDFQEKIFKEGHDMEAAARPILEKITGEDFSPVTAKMDTPNLSKDLSASFDGINLDGDVLFEHKMWNKDLAEQVKKGELDPHYYWQLEQQLLVSGAKKVYFVTSDSFVLESWQNPDDFEFVSEPQYDENGNKFYTAAHHFEMMEYFPVPGRAEKIISGWKDYENVEKNILIGEEDQVWKTSAETYLFFQEQITELKNKIKSLEKQQQPYKEALINIADRKNLSKVIGGGVEVSTVQRKGALDEKKLIEAMKELGANIDTLNEYRKPPSISWKISIDKAEKNNTVKINDKVKDGGNISQNNNDIILGQYKF